VKKEYQLFLLGCCVIAAFNGLSSIVSKTFSFNYAFLASISFLIYALFGYMVTKVTTIKKGVTCAAALGVFDATIGWIISILLKADTGNIPNNIPSTGRWLFTAILVIMFAALAGLMGGALMHLQKSDN
jgi:hypothetical protein